jgi:glucosamine--fructose-6-phosphate aminotransferase (isomerizing)
MMEKGNYRHFMEKEIHDQPEGCQRTIAAYVDALTARTAMPGDIDFKALERIQIVACGTSYIAGVIGKYLIEQLADLPVDVEIASEFRYRQPALRPGSLVIAMSQSGETADTLAALRYCKAKGMKSAVVVNAQESTMAREVDVVWPIHCGPEIGVASTKAFTAQVSVMIALAVAAAKARGDDRRRRGAADGQGDAGGPAPDRRGHRLEDALKEIAVDIAKARDVLFLGRGPMSALALEGALKLKEISYIHAEGYAAGELKHGPIALVDDQTPIIILAPYDSYFEKSASNMSEVMARGGQVVFITDPEGAQARPGRRPGRRHGPGQRPAGLDPGDVGPDPAAGLPRGRGEGRGRRPAAQPRQVGDRGIVLRRPAHRAPGRAFRRRREWLAVAAGGHRVGHGEPAIDRWRFGSP